MAANINQSPLTGVLKEEHVFIDFGEHQGRSVYDVFENNPDYYDFLLRQKDNGNFYIKRTANKYFVLSITLH